MEQKELIEKLQNYNYYKARLEEVQEQIDSICPKVTPTYGNLAAATTNSFSSKVEDEGNLKHELRGKAAKFQSKINYIEKLIDQSGLDERENELMWWLAKNGKLAAYASVKRINKWNTYKIRDRAAAKILTAHNLHNVV